ncbi:hypothetical protein AVEN_215450-1 [Araneus ventricosus]|uniref:Uncharacterized protein n=1 Tax=Araneus ventricosus TaxID=182803 RepID=A0A4Y2JSG1_ARAVE|nr:hypothetical protein AVEN_215450-1 [Araneus ventricosus]
METGLSLIFSRGGSRADRATTASAQRRSAPRLPVSKGFILVPAVGLGVGFSTLTAEPNPTGVESVLNKEKSKTDYKKYFFRKKVAPIQESDCTTGRGSATWQNFLFGSVVNDFVQLDLQLELL